MPPRRKRRPAPDVETNTPPDDARRDPQRTPPESDPPRAEDASVSEYDRELDRLDAATSTRH